MILVKKVNVSGRGPSNALSYMINDLNIVNPPMSTGIDPDIELAAIQKSCNEARFEMVVGIVPANEFLEKNPCLRFVSCIMESERGVPVNEFSSKSITASWVKFAIPEGIEDDRALPKSSSRVNWNKVDISSGMGPARLFTPTITHKK